MIRALDIWLPAYLRQRPGPRTKVHLLMAVCDHFEPFHDTDKRGAMEAMRAWETRWSALADGFRDSGGNRPRHTFFYPIEQYDRDVIDSLAGLCRKTDSEVEVHLHHHDDTEAGLTEALRKGLSDFASHGLLSKDGAGRARFGFIHGNWALDNSDPSGKNCGVSNELSVLRRAGCYADFTMPSAPHRTQTRTVNRIYYAQDTPAPKSHDHGTPVAAFGTAALRDREDHLLMIQGPLALNWQKRKWQLLPKIENGELSGANPPTALRLQLWEGICPMVAAGPPWVFVKLHTHGGIAKNYNMLLGEAMARFHQDLGKWVGEGSATTEVHYVTAREMVNIIHAAEDGKAGNPEDYRHYLYRKLA